MRTTRVLFPLVLFLCGLIIQTSSADAQSTDPKSYSRLVFTANQIQEQAPTTPSSQRRRTEIAKTQFKVVAELFFVPGEPAAPAFIQTRFNARRENHSWQQIDTGLREATPLQSHEYESVMRAATNISMSSKDPYSTLDFGISEMPTGSHIFGTEQIVSSRGPIGDEETEVISVNISIPNEEFAVATNQFSSQVFISYVLKKLRDETPTTRYRKMLYGTVQVAPVDAAGAAKISHLLALTGETCVGAFSGKAN